MSPLSFPDHPHDNLTFQLTLHPFLPPPLPLYSKSVREIAMGPNAAEWSAHMQGAAFMHTQVHMHGFMTMVDHTIRTPGWQDQWHSKFGEGSKTSTLNDVAVACLVAGLGFVFDIPRMQMMCR